MRVELLEGGAVLRLEAQSGADLEALFQLVAGDPPGSRGPLHGAAQERVLERALPFRRDHSSQGLAWRTANGDEVLWALQLRTAWLSYREPATPEAQLRADTAARIGHSLLDALQLVRPNSK